MNNWKRIFGIVAMVGTLALAGCGGGGGSSSTATADTVSGVAAAGSALVGTVYLKDSASSPKELARATTDGAYSFDVTGMTKPFILKAVGTADGTNHTLYSFATAPGTANINPMTNLAVSNAAAGVDPATIYAAPQAAAMQAVANKLPQALQDVQTSLQPLLQAHSADVVNPFTANYKVDHTGLDGMFDVVKMEVASGVVTITNKSDSSTIFTAQVTDVKSGSLDMSHIPPPPAPISVTAKVFDYSNLSAGVPLAGVSVTTVGLYPEITTTTDAAGSFVLSGIPQNRDFQVRMSKNGYADATTATLSLTASQNTSDRPYGLFRTTQLAGWGNTSGKGMIRTRLVSSRDLVNGFIGGAVVTATDKADGTRYPVRYVDSKTGGVSNILTSTDANGLFMIVNLPAGHTVNVTATHPSFTFNSKAFQVQADAVAQTRLVGTPSSGSFSGFTSEMLSGKTFIDNDGDTLIFNANGSFADTVWGASGSWSVNAAGQIVIRDPDVTAVVTLISGTLETGLKVFNSQSDGYTETLVLTPGAPLGARPPEVYGLTITFFAPGQTYRTSWAWDGTPATLSFPGGDPEIVEVLGNPETMAQVPAGTPDPKYVATFVAKNKRGTTTVQVLATHPDGSTAYYGPRTIINAW